MGENSPESYQTQNDSPVIGSGFLINGSADTTNYIQHNGGLDYFWKYCFHNLPNIGAFNGVINVDILSTKLDEIKIYPNVTNDFVNILINNYTGPIKTEIYAIGGDFMGFQIGDKLSLESFSSGIYLCY